MKIIVAVNKINHIGKDGKMLWKSSEDFKHFKELTMGGTLIVGRTTYEKCLNSRDLPGRDTIIIGTGYDNMFTSIKKAIKYSESKDNKDIWVIGGSKIYTQLVPLCEEIHISIIENNWELGDSTFFIPNNYRGKVYTYYFKEDE